MNKQQLINSLKTQREFGVEDVFLDEPFERGVSASDSVSEVKEKANVILETIREAGKASPLADKTNDLSTMDWIAKAQKLADGADSIEKLRDEVENFDGLSIKKLATNCVFGEGNVNSKLMLIGEAPGANEDEQGRPFCGVSGRLLDKMLHFAGYSREKNFYITNTLFWRPPGNRRPTPEEIAICKPFVEKHIALINPDVIVLVGATASLSVLDSKESIGKLRKSMHYYNSPVLDKKIACYAIFHPSYLLRQPSQKKNGWFDMLKIKNFLESKE